MSMDTSYSHFEVDIFTSPIGEVNFQVSIESENGQIQPLRYTSSFGVLHNQSIIQAVKVAISTSLEFTVDFSFVIKEDIYY